MPFAWLITVNDPANGFIREAARAGLCRMGCVVLENAAGECVCRAVTSLGKLLC